MKGGRDGDDCDWHADELRAGVPLGIVQIQILALLGIVSVQSLLRLKIKMLRQLG